MPRPRLHKSSIVVGLLIAAAMMLIDVPGRVVESDYWAATEGFATYEHGWPWVYLRRQTLPSGQEPGDNATFPRDLGRHLPRWGVPWLNAPNWRWWESNEQLDSPRWEINIFAAIGDVVAFLGVMACVVSAWEFRRRRRHRLASFSIADLFIVVTVICAVLGWGAYLWHEHRREKNLEENVDIEFIVEKRICVAPRWMQSLVGTSVFPEFFWRANDVCIILDEDSEGDAHEVAQLKYVTDVYIYNRTLVTQRNGGTNPFPMLRAMPQLDTLMLAVGTPDGLHERNVDEIVKLRQLRTIVLIDMVDASPDLVSRLRDELPNCKIVDYSDYWSR